MIDYVVIRSKRKTVGITVKKGEVIVKAPKTLPKSDIDNFVRQNTKWIISKLEKSKKAEEKFADIFAYKKFLYKGIVLTPIYTESKRFTFDDAHIHIPQKYADKIASATAKEFKRLAKAYLSERLDFIAGRTDMRYNGFSLTNAKTKWGSCDSKGMIRLNWRLVLLSEKHSDYVIIHELCHTKHMDHSKDFWNSVKQYMPDYAACRKFLKECALLTDYCR